ncbi:putative pentatricopeptide repeat-containing protein At1g56570 [Magnolia sinica]|uniref:putative pentatricopeptide repeat-containing protein At1g56570 n=1 Tax=Magnolia sinica TaxID=86752 RepID=UPI00265B0FE9|nr:putative pentatricopeptide repeat-containing protein At1g56570 [Magnolia sinica]
MYANCGDLVGARLLFDEMSEPNLVSWTSMLSSYVQHGYDDLVMQLFSFMCRTGLRPNDFGLSSALKACKINGELVAGKLLHGLIIKCGFKYNAFCSSSVLDFAIIEMYVTFEMKADAYKRFLDVRDKNEICFTDMISSFISDSDDADLNMLEEAKTIHSHIMKAFGEYDLCLGNALIEMYAKCKGVDEAAMACSGLATLDQGRQTHAYDIKSGFQSNAFIGSALIDMYAKCSGVNDAFRAFSNMGEQDLITWSTMMASYAQHGHGEKALKLLSKFQDKPSVPVNDSILSSCLSACASLVALDMGKQIHARTIKTGFKSHLHVNCGIIDMYCKCGSIEDACKFFDKMGGHNVVSWIAMVSGYAHHGLGKDDIELFDKMKEAGVDPS